MSEKERGLENYRKFLESRVGFLEAQVNDLQGKMQGDTCSMCNWMERGDCHAEKEKLRERVRELEGSYKQREGNPMPYTGITTDQDEGEPQIFCTPDSQNQVDPFKHKKIQQAVSQVMEAERVLRELVGRISSNGTDEGVIQENSTYPEQELTLSDILEGTPGILEGVSKRLLDDIANLRNLLF